MHHSNWQTANGKSRTNRSRRLYTLRSIIIPRFHDLLANEIYFPPPSLLFLFSFLSFDPRYSFLFSFTLLSFLILILILMLVLSRVYWYYRASHALINNEIIDRFRSFDIVKKSVNNVGTRSSRNRLLKRFNVKVTASWMRERYFFLSFIFFLFHSYNI